MFLTNEFKTLVKKYDNDFKADIMENIQLDILEGKTVKESLQVFINECFPIWIEESKEEKDQERKKLLKYYQRSFKKVTKL